jgi:hypothetical protein
MRRRPQWSISVSSIDTHVGIKSDRYAVKETRSNPSGIHSCAARNIARNPFLVLGGVERMQMIVSPIKRAMLAHDLASEDRTLSDLLASVMASAGFGLILVTADK